ncbi:unnamed protein product [Cladocopium goreaui]|uniref:N-acetyltransferase domain-containing protein n=1 Tax=Cladocopium goreaui TaxID=2562237 RepID=A0A9P1CAL2_9DINO|nr:unnamed protein product [Cladocopium goreaui]
MSTRRCGLSRRGGQLNSVVCFFIGTILVWDSDRTFVPQNLTAETQRVFVDGDCVPKPFFAWLRQLSRQSPVAAIVAFKGKTSNGDKALSQEAYLRENLLKAGIDDSLLLLQPSVTGAERLGFFTWNAADVVLTFLFARYGGLKNYIVSDDRQWFKEVVKSRPGTIWITGDRFRVP